MYFNKGNKNGGMIVKEVEIGKLNGVGMEEAYEEFYSCPNCGSECIIRSSSYCSNCGAKLNWKNEE